IPPIRGGGDMRCEPADEFATRLSIIDPKEHVSSEVRRRPRSENSRLDLVQVERRRLRRKTLVYGFLDGQHAAFLSWVRVHSDPDPDDDWRALLRNLVEEFIDRLADALEPVNLRHRQIWMSDVPAFRRDLVLGEIVLCFGT